MENKLKKTLSIFNICIKMQLGSSQFSFFSHSLIHKRVFVLAFLIFSQRFKGARALVAPTKSNFPNNKKMQCLPGSFHNSHKRNDLKLE